MRGFRVVVAALVAVLVPVVSVVPAGSEGPGGSSWLPDLTALVAASAGTGHEWSGTVTFTCDVAESWELHQWDAQVTLRTQPDIWAGETPEAELELTGVLPFGPAGWVASTPLIFDAVLDATGTRPSMYNQGLLSRALTAPRREGGVLVSDLPPFMDSLSGGPRTTDRVWRRGDYWLVGDALGSTTLTLSELRISRGMPTSWGFVQRIAWPDPKVATCVPDQEIVVSSPWAALPPPVVVGGETLTATIGGSATVDLGANDSPGLVYTPLGSGVCSGCTFTQSGSQVTLTVADQGSASRSGWFSLPVTVSWPKTRGRVAGSVATTVAVQVLPKANTLTRSLYEGTSTSPALWQLASGSMDLTSARVVSTTPGLSASVVGYQLEVAAAVGATGAGTVLVELTDTAGATVTARVELQVFGKLAAASDALVVPAGGSASVDLAGNDRHGTDWRLHRFYPVPFNELVKDPDLFYELLGTDPWFPDESKVPTVIRWPGDDVDLDDLADRAAWGAVVWDDARDLGLVVSLEGSELTVQAPASVSGRFFLAYQAFYLEDNSWQQDDSWVELRVVPAAAPLRVETPHAVPVAVPVAEQVAGSLDPATLVVVEDPDHGSVETAGAGFVYTPERGFEGTDRFTWAATDRDGQALGAEVTVVVGSGQPAPPTTTPPTTAPPTTAPPSDEQPPTTVPPTTVPPSDEQPPTTVPPTTVPPTDEQPPMTPPQVGDDVPELVRTGTEATSWALAGLGLILAGAVLVGAARRRRQGPGPTA